MFYSWAPFEYPCLPAILLIALLLRWFRVVQRSEEDYKIFDSGSHRPSGKKPKRFGMYECNILKPSIKNSYCLKKNTIWAVDYLSRRDRSELDFGLSWGLCVSRCLLYRVYNIIGRKRLWFFIPLQWNEAFIGMKFLIILSFSFPETTTIMNSFQSNRSRFFY